MTPARQAPPTVRAEMADDKVEAVLNAVCAAQNRVRELQLWIQWWTKIKENYSETATKLSKNFDERIANAEKAGATLGALINSSPPNQRNLPHFGWHDTVSIAKLIYDLKQE